MGFFCSNILEVPSLLKKNSKKEKTVSFNVDWYQDNCFYESSIDLGNSLKLLKNIFKNTMKV